MYKLQPTDHESSTVNTDKLEKENRALKKERFELGEKVKRIEDARTILNLEVEHRNEELKRLSGVEKRVEELEAALAVRTAGRAPAPLTVPCNTLLVAPVAPFTMKPPGTLSATSFKPPKTLSTPPRAAPSSCSALTRSRRRPR